MKIGLNLNISLWSPGERDYRYVLMLPFWFPFYGWYSNPGTWSPSISLVLPVFAVGVFRNKGDKSFKIAFKIWRRELVREPFGMTSEEALLVLSDTFNYSGLMNLRGISYALWSLRKRGWSTERIVERING